MTSYGNSCVSRAHGLSSRTVITPNTVGAGIITSFCCYIIAVGSGFNTFNLKIFRNDGTNWVFVGQSGTNIVVAGLNTFTGLSIPVKTGDYIAFYDHTTGGTACDTSGSVYYQGFEVSNTEPISSWSTGNFYTVFSVQVTVTCPSVSIALSI
jgi:hypothetical protein